MTLSYPLSPQHLTTAKWAFTTRRVDRHHAGHLLCDLTQARSGDLVLGRVDAIGSHKKIQLATGRASQLYPGDHVVLACGGRYAPDQFEGIAELDRNGADMLAGGGVIGRMRQRNTRMSAPTRIVPLGLLGQAPGQALNTTAYAVPSTHYAGGMTVIAVAGASMNSGKTTAVASLVHGLTRSGRRVAAIKATGTGAYGDYNAYVDAGAHYVADFVDTGQVSTYLEPLAQIEQGLETLLGHAANAGCEVALVELADGVFQRETAALLRRDTVRNIVSGLVFAAPDALSAAGGAQVLSQIGLPPVAITGLLTRSSLAAAEAAEATGLSIFSRDALRDPAKAADLLRQMTGGCKEQAQPVAA